LVTPFIVQLSVEKLIFNLEVPMEMLRQLLKSTGIIILLVMYATPPINTKGLLHLANRGLLRSQREDLTHKHISGVPQPHLLHFRSSFIVLDVAEDLGNNI